MLSILKEKVDKLQRHNHTFTCAKKGKTITIKEMEGHGKFDGYKKGPELRNIPVCRFKIPKFPLDETKLILRLPKDTPEDVIKERKKDLDQIIKFLIRQTYCEHPSRENENWHK